MLGACGGRINGVKRFVARNNELQWDFLWLCVCLCVSVTVCVRWGNWIVKIFFLETIIPSFFFFACERVREFHWCVEKIETMDQNFTHTWCRPQIVIMMTTWLLLLHWFSLFKELIGPMLLLRQLLANYEPWLCLLGFLIELELVILCPIKNWVRKLRRNWGEKIVSLVCERDGS